MNKTYIKQGIAALIVGSALTVVTGFVPTTMLLNNLGPASGSLAVSITDYGYPMKYRIVSKLPEGNTTKYHADAIALDVVMWSLFSVVAYMVLSQAHNIGRRVKRAEK